MLFSLFLLLFSIVSISGRGNRINKGKEGVREWESLGNTSYR